MKTRPGVVILRGAVFVNTENKNEVMSKTSITKWTIGDVIEMDRRKAFHVQPEYQRGIVWKMPHMQLLIDSAMRGYGMPMLYLRPHEKNDGMYDIIDGQQRIHTFRGFVEGLVRVSNNEQRGFRLLNPCLPSEKKHFPTFQQGIICEWGGKKFSDFSGELRNDFLGREIPVTLLHFSNKEARDMFIRLQGGYDLSPQEKRDAWFSDFCDEVLRIGGKPQMNKGLKKTFSGHEFFREIMRLNPEKDRGKTRQLAAQIMMLFLCRNGESRSQYTSIYSQHIDGCYRKHVNLSEGDKEILSRCCKVMKKLSSLFGGWIDSKNKLKAHEAIHLTLFADMLFAAFEDKWQSRIFNAFIHFRDRMPQGYIDRIGKKSGDSNVIMERHAIFVNKMLHLMGDDIAAKDLDDPGDPPLDFKEAVFYRDNGKCCTCKRPVHWEDACVRQVNSRRGISACPLLDIYELVHDEKC